jgi:GNAT superfamily N-acetyltransferase
MPILDGNDESNNAAAQLVREGLIAEAERRVGPQKPWSLGIYLRDDQGQVAGGAVGMSYWGWLFIDLLWVRNDLRHQGWGQRLLQAAEAEARSHSSIGVWLDTFSFQARPFYEANGYEVFGEIENHPAGASRWFLKKRL